MTIRDEELLSLLHDMIDRYGYDFTGYSEASLKRRIEHFMVKDQIPDMPALRSLIIQSSDYFRHLVEEMTVNVTEMLRDPPFYKTIREEVLPALATYPFIRIWHAGCSTGEEVYSMAILLQEAGILHKSRLYATDINPDVIEKARSGIFPASQMRKYSENYIQSGGKNDFSSYYSSNYHLAKFDERLSEKMIFATHNLVADSSFNEFQLILCRNTLIYFNKKLQSRVLELFDHSLELLGFLALGTKESLRFSGIESKFRQI
ncbi:MAG TPA: protein-glutamate O-methyltransferase CheR, partial [Puia sp.]